MLTSIGVALSVLFSPQKRVWLLAIGGSSILIFVTIVLFPTKGGQIAWRLLKDSITTPLIFLRVWLTPLALLARVGHLSKESIYNQKVFITLIFIILFFLLVTFLAKKFIVLFLGFEGTLIPTLFLITRWGNQQERIEAGTFFVFYTLVTSLPLFLGLISIYQRTTKILITHLNIKLVGHIKKLLAVCCITAFLVKVPIFAIHLWLPKAHVEAPVAGSMILAAVLLKMGGYGFSRLSLLFFIPIKSYIQNILVPFCVWGGLLTSIICLTQTDLKSLIAYSSVSHMRFMIAGISVLSSWAIAGGLIVMIAHGIVSSALFCIANTLYERSATRTMIINRSTKLIYALTPILWLVLACAKMGIPPLPNSVGEVLVISSIVAKKIINFIPTLVGVIATGIFRLFMFLAVRSGKFQKWANFAARMKERETKTLAAHALPLVILIISPNLITPWLN